MEKCGHKLRVRAFGMCSNFFMPKLVMTSTKGPRKNPFLLKNMKAPRDCRDKGGGTPLK